MVIYSATIQLHSFYYFHNFSSWPFLKVTFYTSDKKQLSMLKISFCLGLVILSLYPIIETNFLPFRFIYVFFKNIIETIISVFVSSTALMDITWMLHQIFMFSNKVKLVAG